MYGILIGPLHDDAFDMLADIIGPPTDMMIAATGCELNFHHRI